MKILHISSAKTWRGGEQQIAYLLQSNLFESIVFCPENSALLQYCNNNNIETFSYKSGLFQLPITVKSFLNLAKKADLLHIHDSKAHDLLLYASIFNKNLKAVLSRKVDFKKKPSFFTQIKYNISTIKKIICVSNAVKQVTLPIIKQKNKLEIIYDGVDVEQIIQSQSAKDELRSKFNIDKNTQIIANIAAYADHKDYFTFIDTAEIVLQSKPDLIFLAIGDGNLKAELEAYIATKKLEDKVILTGFISNIKQQLHFIDMLLYSSKEEGLGQAIIEAMSIGLPIVAINAGGIKEVVEADKSGLLCAIKNADCLANSVLRVLNDNDLKTTLSNGAKARAKYFSVDKMQQQHANLY